MDSNPEAMIMNGGVFGLEILSCYYSMAKRDTNCLKVKVFVLLGGRVNKKKHFRF